MSAGRVMEQRDPWDRYGWVMGAVWLLFLTPTLLGILLGDRPVWAKLVALTCLAAFASIYVIGLMRIYEDDTWGGPTGKGVRYVAALIALAIATAVLSGETAMGMAAFVVAFGMFALPVRAGVGLLVATIVVALALPWLVESFSNSWYAAPVVLVVGLGTGVVRILERRGATYREMTDEIAMAAERDRVARDVHDVLGHSLTVVTVKAELAERLVETDPARARAELVEIQELTRESLAEIRATVAGLRVARLTEELESASRALSGAGVVATMPDDPSVVEPRHRIVLAWALREAVTNVVRHSEAGHCEVRLGEDWLAVADDGRGMSGHKEGNGLRGLRERVHGAGGSVEIATAGSRPGTTVRVQL